MYLILKVAGRNNCELHHEAKQNSRAVFTSSARMAVCRTFSHVVVCHLRCTKYENRLQQTYFDTETSKLQPIDTSATSQGIPQLSEWLSCYSSKIIPLWLQWLLNIFVKLLISWSRALPVLGKALICHVPSVPPPTAKYSMLFKQRDWIYKARLCLHIPHSHTMR